MTWLRKSDYFPYIREDKLDEILYDDTTFLTAVEKASIEEVASFMRHRYDTDRIFKDIGTYSDSTTYFPNDILEWTETAWSDITTYALDDRISYSDKIYKSLQGSNINQNPVTETAYWVELADNESLWYSVIRTIGNLPSEEITYTVDNYTTRYDLLSGWDRITNTSLFFRRINDYVYIYLTEAARDAAGTSEARFLYPKEGIDLPALVDVEAWDNKTIRGVIEIHGFIPDATEWQVDTEKYWIEGDNRNQKLLQVMVDVVLYHIHSRIQPRNIPNLRKERYDGNSPDQAGGAVGWLKNVRRGVNNLSLPIYMNEEKGKNILYGSESKNNWDY